MGHSKSETGRIYLSGPDTKLLKGAIRITGSKSESNRLLLLQALYPQIKIENLSNSDDSRVMQQGLASNDDRIDIHHAGTAMRFLTAYFSGQEGRELVLTGSDRMKQRPIRILVEALNALGARITYTERPGCPPLKIRGTQLKGGSVSLPADVSSQYISALLLIAPSLPEGLKLNLEGRITSLPYIQMTLGLLTRLGIPCDMKGNTILVSSVSDLQQQTCVVESDWSSASYFYSLLALAKPGSRISLEAYREGSLQGDSVLQSIFSKLGVRSDFKGSQLILTRDPDIQESHLKLDLLEAPDLAQTLAVCCFGLGISCELTGLHTLKIKETDRLHALHAELTKMGASLMVTEDSLHLQGGHSPRKDQTIATYNDHRMAMAFAPLALRTTLYIADAGVVTKSYPGYWEDLGRLGIKIENA
ncbi:MAG: 3-phosphoshikimate 1-carboxyvinyltransferase [Robiginitalea sp.]